MSDEKGLTIVRTIPAPIEKVWDAWTKPELVQQWWGPEGFTSPSIKIDLRQGGQYIFAMHGPKGSEWDKDIYSAGIYQEIVPYQKLVVSDHFSDQDGNMLDPTEAGQDADFPKESLMTVRFDKVDDNQTKLTIEYPEPNDKAELEAIKKSGAVDGWNSSLNKLEQLLRKP